MNKKKTGFTLVELIVVITILAVLWTIAFVSFSWYAKSARDSTRVSDLKSIEKILEFTRLDLWYYPEPSDSFSVTYSGATIWNQGTFNTSVLQKTKRLSEAPLDPLTQTPYTYSVLNTKQEYQIWGTLESSELSSIWNVYAWDLQGYSYIKWTYNGQLAKVSTGATLYILAVPSIISGDVSLRDYQTLLWNNKLSISWGETLPWSYLWSSFDTNKGNWFTPAWNIVIFSGTDLPSTPSEIGNLVTGLQQVYTGTLLSQKSAIASTLNLSTNTIQAGWTTLINNYLWGKIETQESNISNWINIENCKTILDTWWSIWDGNYSIDPNSDSNTIDVYCDMTDWGWTRIIDGFTNTSITRLDEFWDTSAIASSFWWNISNGISWWITNYNYTRFNMDFQYESVKVVHNGLYNSPSGGLGFMLLDNEAVNSDSKLILSSADAWTNSGQWQSLYVGENTILNQSQTQIINREDIIDYWPSTQLSIWMTGYPGYWYTRRYIKELWLK